MDPLDKETVPTEAQARKVAKLMGCEGAHKWKDGWSPCESREALMALIRGGAAGYRAFQHSQGRKAKGVMAVRRIVDREAKRRRSIIRKYRIEIANPDPMKFEDLGERGVVGLHGSGAGITVSRSGAFGS